MLNFTVEKLYLKQKESPNIFCRYSRTPEIETADLSQSHASLNLSQFRAYCLPHINSSTATKDNCNMRLMLEIN